MGHAPTGASIASESIPATLGAGCRQQAHRGVGAWPTGADPGEARLASGPAPGRAGPSARAEYIQGSIQIADPHDGAAPAAPDSNGLRGRLSMNDTVCPKCGHKALSVATRCPRCGQAFDTRYYQHSSQGPRRKLAIPGLLIAGVVLMILAANAVWRLPGTTSGRPTQSGALAPSPAPQPGPGQKVAAPAVRADSLAVAPSRERTPASDPPPPIQTGNRAPAPIPPEPTAMVSSTGVISRYASTWINIRSRRSPRAPVLRILRPGDLVQVDSLQVGWYRVVSQQRPFGYVDRRLLSNSPRQTAP